MYTGPNENGGGSVTMVFKKKAWFCKVSIILTIKKGGQITSQLELKEITLGCSKSEYRT